MSLRSWPELLAHLLLAEELSPDEASWALDQIMQGQATSAQIAGFALALRAKGETAEELSALVTAMLNHAIRIELPGRWVDTCGTGGDRHHTVNISTAAALVVAAESIGVVKHGNRAASSSSGSADVLAALGIPIELEPAHVAQVAQEVGITFCFAPLFHGSLKHAAAARKEIGVPTFFNVLGPLANPATPQAQAVGVADERLAPVMAHVLQKRGVDALVFRGEDGLDELTLSGTSQVWVVSSDGVSEENFDPATLGIEYAPLAALRGGDAAHNADMILDVLKGAQGPVRDAIALNAAAAIAAHQADQERGLSLDDRLARGYKRATDAIDSGRALAKLEQWRSVAARF